MNVFLAIVFFCADGQCAFWQSKELTYDRDKCLEIVSKVQKELSEQGVESAGTCAQINTRNHI
jgi:hypothetical protein